MPKRRQHRNWRRIRKLLLLLLLVWLVFEGRFYIPKKIRPPDGIQPVEVEMKTTSYCHCRKCCSYKWFLFMPYQKRGFLQFRFKQVGRTSSGEMVRPGTIAADTSIYPYGTVMYIPGYGYGRVEDTGGAVKGRHIDLYRPNHWFARKWGVQQKRVKVWIPEKKPPDTVKEIEVLTNAPGGPVEAGETVQEHEVRDLLFTNGPPPSAPLNAEEQEG